MHRYSIHNDTGMSSEKGAVFQGKSKISKLPFHRMGDTFHKIFGGAGVARQAAFPPPRQGQEATETMRPKAERFQLEHSFLFPPFSLNSYFGLEGGKRNECSKGIWPP
jgi:hypothetical protein